MKQNKTSSYLKYAVGEILLVVFGILIALQINNWNETRKIKEKENQVLAEIISDLDYTLEDLDRVISNRRNNLYRTIYAINSIIEVLESDQAYYDSLSYHFRAAHAYDNIDFKISGYQSLVSIGTDLIENPTLRSSIGKFHTSTINDVNGGFEEVHQDFYSYMIDYLRKKFTTVLDESSFEKLEPNDFDALKNDKEYIQSLKTFLSVNVFYLDRLTEAKEEALQLKRDIKNYLDD